MDQQDIRIFQAVIKHKSFSKASQELAMSQSAVSQRVRVLEDELQTQLVQRKKGMRSIELTEHGIRFAILSDKWLSLYREMLSIREEQTILNLTVASPNSLNNYLFLPLFHELSRNEPNLRLFIRTQHTVEIYDQLDKHDADIGFVFYNARYKNVMARRVFSEKMYMVCQKGSIWKNHIVHPNDLDPSNEIFTSWSPPIEQWHNLWWSPSIIPHVRADTPSLLLSFINSPRYWAICPASVIRDFHMEDKIEIHEFSDPPPPRECFMLSHKYQTDKEVRAITIFRKYFDQFVKQLSFEVQL